MKAKQAEPKLSTTEPTEWWILEGDWGGQLYAAIPTNTPGLSRRKARKLLKYIDAKEWKCNKGDGTLLWRVAGKVGEKLEATWREGVFEREPWIDDSGMMSEPVRRMVKWLLKRS